jgi:iron complex transport system ATP-binding protein
MYNHATYNQAAKVIQVSNISVFLEKRLILDNVSLDVGHGCFHVLLGPNGAGKTTLLRSIAGLIPLHRGKILLCGKEISNFSHKEFAKIVCYVPQLHIPAFAYSVIDFVVMGRNPHLSTFSTPGTKDRELAWEALKSLGIEKLGQRNYLSLSGGEQQLIILARGLVQSASIFLLDEPVAHLDYRYQHLVLDTVNKLVKEQNKTALVTLHDPNMAVQYGEYITVLNNKKVISTMKNNQQDFIGEMENTLSSLYNYKIAIKEIEGSKVVIRMD